MLRFPQFLLAALLASTTVSIATAQWMNRQLSVRRHSIGAVTVGTKAIFAGGEWRGSGPMDAVDIFDGTTSAWTTSTLPSPASGLDGASVGPYAMFAGASSSTDEVFVYDARLEVWSTVRLSAARSGMQVVSSGTQVLFAGGDDLVGFSSVVDVYDYAIGAPSDPAAWTTEELSRARAVAAGFNVGSAAVFAGGRSVTAATTHIDYFDPAAAVQSRHSLESGWFPSAGTGLGSRAVMATTLAPAPGARFETYDFKTGTSTVGPDRSPVPGLAAVTLGHRAMFVGNGEVSPVPFGVWFYDGIRDEWSTAVLPATEYGLSSTVVGRKAVFAGGFYSGNIIVFNDGIGGTYCSPAIPNSTGSPATIDAQGAPATAIGGSTRLNVRGLPRGSVGYVIASQTRGSSLPASSQGRICLAGTIVRLTGAANLIAGTKGSVSFDHSAVPSLPQTVIQPGEAWNYQCWYRDSNPGATSNFTDAISVGYQ